MGERSTQNLKEAFAGESQANRKYLAFAKQADKEIMRRGLAYAARHGITVAQVTADFARALRMWSRCLHARFPSLVWPWL